MADAPLSLYLDLEPNTAADLEVVAKTALAFADLIREVSYFVDPSLQIRIEFDSGTPGSLSLNSRVRGLAKKAIDPKTLAAIAITVGAYFRHELTDWATHKFFDSVLTSEQKALSDADIQKISEHVADLLKKRTALPQAQNVYREVEKDTAIKGVGVSAVPGRRPADVVPRAEFAARIEQPPVLDIAPRRRKTPYSGRITLVSPVLLKADRRWKFIGPTGEFGATVEDNGFVERVLSGHVRMAEGTQLNVDMETTEEFDGRVWQVKEHKVLKVKSARRPPHQPSLPLSPPKKETRGSQ
jgi:hypothetical protein